MPFHQIPSVNPHDVNFSYLLKYLSVDTLRESAADCLHEVVCKGIVNCCVDVHVRVLNPYCCRNGSHD